MWHGIAAVQRGGRRRRRPIAGNDPAIPLESRFHRAPFSAVHVGYGAGASGLRDPDSDAPPVDRAAAGHARGDLGRVPLLAESLGLHCQSQPQHVHADCTGHGRSLRLQLGGRRVSNIFSGCLSGRPRSGGRLFRSRRRHHDPGASGAGPGAQSQGADRQRHPVPAGVVAAHRPEDRRRRRRSGAFGGRAAGRSAAGAPGGQGPGGRPGAGGREQRRRVHDQRRAHPGRETLRETP